MSNNKQSSIDWFAKEVAKLCDKLENNEIDLPRFQWEFLVIENQFKEMHKEEITTAMNIAFRDGLYIAGENYDESYKSPYDDWEDYYNETFGCHKLPK